MVGRIAVVDVRPVVSCGQYPSRAVTGETLTVRATVFREGHDAVACNVAATAPDGTARPFRRMVPGEPGTDRWYADLHVDCEGLWSFVVEGWSDPLGTWWHDAPLKVDAGVDTELMLEEGARLYERAAKGLPKDVTKSARLNVTGLADVLRDTSRDAQERMKLALADDVVALLSQHPIRELVTPSEPRQIWVDRQRALYGAWYELFPRSEGAHVPPDGGPMRSGTFRTATERLPAVAEMGFDVVYLPPIHPVGEVNRKGPNNTLTPGPNDPGSPWAIGSRLGGHDAIHPDLGTLEDFDAFVEETRRLGMEVALDLALQCAPDHPWATEHPEWFTTRADGTIAFAENPPKKYQDIYPLNFDNDPDGLYAEVLRVVRHWVDHGVKIFRVDNPHTKPLEFWEWLIAQVKATDPDVLFLAEAFTRPAMMQGLGAIGFHQSYTYFTWRTAKWEIEEYLRELSHETDHMVRPNFFVNTPDILHAYLQYGGPAAFKIRAALAATGSPSWGVYAGYELFEHVAVRPGSEEYLDSEKYQVRIRDWDAAERDGRTLAPYLTRLNEIRRQHPALQLLRNLAIHWSDDENVLVFSKTAGHDDTVIVVINTDPHAARETTVHLDMATLGLDEHDTFVVHDEITGADWNWSAHNYVRLDPFQEPAHILTVRRTA